MNRKSLLSIFLCLISGIALLTGCGGGGGGGKDPVLIEKGPSSDYLGLEDGAVLVFHSKTFDIYNNPNDTEETITMKVKNYQANIFKTKQALNQLMTLMSMDNSLKKTVIIIMIEENGKRITKYLMIMVS